MKALNPTTSIAKLGASKSTPEIASNSMSNPGIVKPKDNRE